MNDRDLLRRRRTEVLEELSRQRNDYAQGIESGAAQAQSVISATEKQRLGEMTGGFGGSKLRGVQGELAENRGVLNREYGENVSAANKQFDLQEKFLADEEKRIREESRRAKLGGVLQAGGTILGAALSPFTGGASMAAGAALGSIGNTLYGTGAPPQIDLSFISDFQNFRNQRKLLKQENDRWVGGFESRKPYALEG